MSNIIWDSLFIQGNIIIFKAIIALFNLLKNEIMGKTGIEEINNLFEESTKYLNDYNFINYYLILKKFEFNYKIISFSRSELEDKIIENINNTNKFNLERNKKNKEEKKRSSFMQNITDCNKEWPICIYDNDYKYRIVSYFYFMIYPGNINIIKDYFYIDINNNKNNKKKIKEKNDNNFNFNDNNNDNNIPIDINTEIKYQNRENNDNDNDICITKPRKKSNNAYNNNNNNYIYNAIDSFEKDKDSISTHSENCQFKEINNEMDIYKELRIERRLHFCDKLFIFHDDLNFCNNSEKEKNEEKDEDSFSYINNFKKKFENNNNNKAEINDNDNKDKLNIQNIDKEFDTNFTLEESKKKF
jgi:hypothetical protein